MNYEFKNKITKSTFNYFKIVTLSRSSCGFWFNSVLYKY